MFSNRDTTENVEKDEDTDGISIISDSDPESITSAELNYEKCLQENRLTEQQPPEFVSVNPLPTNNNNGLDESIRGDEDFLGGSNGKLKTYVHRRNKRLSTMLNIIVLGSVITAAGVAIGHMWGAKNDCSMHTPPSVNKILSNLYKLQEENAYLRNKLKELTLVNNMQMQHRKTESERLPIKQQRCRKMFEESLNNKNVNQVTKCVDNDNADKLLEHHLVGHEYEKDFLTDIDKLKNIYQQNKSWLDAEIAKRTKRDDGSVKLIKNNLKSPKSTRINEEHKAINKRAKRQLESISEMPVNTETVINVTELVGQPVINIKEDYIAKETLPERISYADSLKSEHKIVQTDTNEANTQSKTKEYPRKKKPQKVYDVSEKNSSSEEDLRKDNRYNDHKIKSDRKKNDRHKIHKKQKRRNKYEQWEMKGGYMKDYDDFSVTSSQDNEYAPKNKDKNFLSRDYEQNNYINQFSEIGHNVKPTEALGEKMKSDNRIPKRGKNKDKDMCWFEKRAALRTEARKKLEQELFGESTPNNAGWYFRRMQRREQCRVKGDNSTYKKLSRRLMNYKTKH